MCIYMYIYTVSRVVTPPCPIPGGHPRVAGAPFLHAVRSLLPRPHPPPYLYIPPPLRYA